MYLGADTVTCGWTPSSVATARRRWMHETSFEVHRNQDHHRGPTVPGSRRPQAASMIRVGQDSVVRGRRRRRRKDRADAAAQLRAQGPRVQRMLCGRTSSWRSQLGNSPPRDRVDSTPRLFPMLRWKADSREHSQRREQKMLRSEAHAARTRLMLIDERRSVVADLVHRSSACCRNFATAEPTCHDRRRTPSRRAVSSTAVLPRDDSHWPVPHRVLNHPEIGRLFLGGAMGGVDTPRTQPARPGPAVP